MNMEDKNKEKVEINVDDIFEDDPVEEKETKKDKKADKKAVKELEEVKAELAKVKIENEELNNKYLMNLAESKNYKKRLDEEMDRFYKFATFDMCKELIGILDSFDFALDKKQEDEKMDKFLDGFRLTRNQIYKVLEKEGVTEIEALGKEFDPNFMVSISHVNDKTKKEQEVTHVFMKGYMYKERVLRPANVVINMIEDEETQE